MAEKQDVKKVVLAYSGGLDTSVIVPWLRNNYGDCEVICFCADLGQEEELDGLEEKAIKSGASKLYIRDLREEFPDRLCVSDDASRGPSTNGSICWEPRLRARSSASTWLILLRSKGPMRLRMVQPAKGTIRYGLN